MVIIYNQLAKSVLWGEFGVSYACIYSFDLVFSFEAISSGTDRDRDYSTIITTRLENSTTTFHHRQKTQSIRDRYPRSPYIRLIMSLIQNTSPQILSSALAKILLATRSGTSCR